MDIFKSAKFCKLCLFSLFLIMPFSAAHCQEQIDVNRNENDFIFIKKMNTISNKIEKYKIGLNFGKLLDQLVDIKTLVNEYTGQNIRLDNYFEKIMNDLKLRGVQLNGSIICDLENILNEKIQHKIDTLYLSKICWMHLSNMDEHGYPTTLGKINPELLNYTLSCFENRLEYSHEEAEIIFSGN